MMGTMEEMYLDELTTGRNALLESCHKMEGVADYCEENYVKAKDKKRALEETKNCTTQSLASVAYQINTLATSMLQVLDYTTTQLAGMNSSLNNIDLTIDLHGEKVGRQEFKSLQTAKEYKRSRKLTKPEELPRNPGKVEYLSLPIDYSSFDSVGHGMKLGLPSSSPRSSRSSSVSSSSSFASRQMNMQMESPYGSLRQLQVSSRPTLVPTVPGLYGGRGDTPQQKLHSFVSTTPQTTREQSGVGNGGSPTMHSPPPAPPSPPILSQASVSGSGKVVQPVSRVPDNDILPPPPDQINTVGGTRPFKQPTSEVHVIPPSLQLQSTDNNAKKEDFLPPPSPFSMPPPPSPLTLAINSGSNSLLTLPPQTELLPPPSPLEGKPNTSTLRRNASRSTRPKNRPPPPPASVGSGTPAASSQGALGTNTSGPTARSSIPAAPPTPPISASIPASGVPVPPPPPPPPPIGSAAVKASAPQASTPKSTNQVPLKPPRGFAEQLQLRLSEVRSHKTKAADDDEQRLKSSRANGGLLPSTTKTRNIPTPTIGIVPAMNEIGNDDPLSPPREFVQTKVPDWAPREYVSKVVAVFDYAAQHDDEMTFQEGDVIYVTVENDNGWLKGVRNGVTALLPGNYVEQCL